MIYFVKHTARNGEKWTVEIKAHNRPSAVEQVRWWYNEGRYTPKISFNMKNYGFIRYKLSQYDTWTPA